MSSSSRVRRLAAVMQGLCDGGIDPEVDHRTPVALVIGAGSGIGQAVATKFAKVSESVWADRVHASACMVHRFLQQAAE